MADSISIDMVDSQNDAKVEGSKSVAPAEKVECNVAIIPSEYQPVSTGDGNSWENDEKSEARKRAYTFTPRAPDNSPTILTWKDLKVTTKTTPEKVLLNKIGGAITGGFWAIMGPSGGGKTTLLSTLSLRIDSRHMDIEGEVRINGKEYSKADLKAMSAYVMQDDVLHAELTVAETLSYAAKLRLPPTFTDEERTDRGNEVLRLMGITHVSKVIVGDSRRKGISGGERKRLCVACELLNRPRLLFLDEPTSGLDSSTALTVCSVLKNLADAGECTVVCTIHQPQQKIFALFDNLILLKKGEIVYQGACDKSLRFLESIGHPCPAGVNPADFLIDVISQTPAEGAEGNTETERKAVPVDLSMGQEKGLGSSAGRRSWLSQLLILCERNLKQYTRCTDTIFMNFCATVLVAVFIGCGIWHDLGTTQADAVKIAPSLFFTSVTQGIFASLQCVNSFPSERAVMLRERQAGSYWVSSYFMAKTLADMLTQLWPPMLFSVIVYPLLGYQRRADKFFLYMMFMILDTMAATSLATAVERSTVVLSFLFEICRLYGGFFTSPNQLDGYPHWRFADGLSYIKYVFMGVALNELTGLEFSCTADQISSNKCIRTGEAIIADKGYDKYTIGMAAGILVFFIVGTRFIGYLGLRFVKG